MKRTLLIAGLVAFGLNASAQCSPNQAYADSLFGAWPDTITNFSSGMVDVLYSDTLNLLVPTDAGAIDPMFTGFTIDSVALVQVSGLPPGISVMCTSQTNAPCTFMTGQVGCGLIEGTPTQTGTFPLVIEVNAYASLFGSAQAVPYSFPGYSITITENTSGVAELQPVKLTGVKNVPNPFAERTVIEFGLSKAAPVKVTVFNLVGAELWSRTLQGKNGPNKVSFDAVSFESGIYIYHVESADSKFTGRMMVNR